MIPLEGHTVGHCLIAVEGERGNWLGHAGDAYFHHGEMEAPPHCSPGLRLFQLLVAWDNGKRVHNQQRLRQAVLDNQSALRVFSAHDAVEFDRFAGQRS